MAIIPFSAGIRPNSGSSFKSLEGEDDISPQKYIRKTSFFDIYDEVKYIGQVIFFYLIYEKKKKNFRVDKV